MNTKKVIQQLNARELQQRKQNKSQEKPVNILLNRNHAITCDRCTTLITKATTRIVSKGSYVEGRRLFLIELY